MCLSCRKIVHAEYRNAACQIFFINENRCRKIICNRLQESKTLSRNKTAVIRNHETSVLLYFVKGMENSGCPESKKLYPGDCRLFYKCVPLSDSAHAYVWVPSRCTAGLVFQPTLKRCVLPGNDWNCQQDNQDIFDLPFYNDLDEEEEEEEEENNVEVTTMDGAEAQKKSEDFDSTTESPGIFGATYNPANSVLNAMEQDRVPLSVVNNTPIDQIGNQMQRLTQLINSLKASPTSVAPPSETTYEKVTPVVYSALPQKPPYHSNPSRNTQLPYKSPDSPEYEINLLPTQLNKITAQLIMQAPPSNKQSGTNLNLLAIDTLKHSKQNLSTAAFISNPLTYTNTEHLVSALFQKYLTNSSFMNRGEYVKKSPILIPVTTTRKPQLNFKQSDNSITQLSSEHHFTVPNNRISSFPHTNAFYGKSCLNGVRLPNPNDCTRYFLCNSSTTMVQSYACPPNTAFNKFKRMCDVAEYQRCVKQIDGYPEKEEIEHHNKVPCDTQMCGGLQNFGEWNQRRFNCPGALEFCEKRQRCLPPSLCR